MWQKGRMIGKSIIDKTMSDCKCNVIDGVPQKYTSSDYSFRQGIFLKTEFRYKKKLTTESCFHLL